MLNIPSALKEQVEEHMRNKPVPDSSRGAYKKWLRYYLDFCSKYNLSPTRKQSLPHFIRKLQEKRQAKVQQEQAARAITLYYETLKSKGLSSKKSMPGNLGHPGYALPKDKKHFSVPFLRIWWPE